MASVKAAMLRGTEGKITDEMVEKVLAEVGKEYPAKDQYNTEASIDAIKHWAQGIGDINPLWQDTDYAKQTSYGDIIAPPTFLYSCWGRAGIQGLPGIHALHIGDEWIFHKRIHRNAKIIVTGGVQSLVEKTTSFAGRSFLQTHFRNFRDESGELIATMYANTMRTERDTASSTKKYQSSILPYTNEQLEAVWKGIEDEVIRGSAPRYGDDVEIGEELPPLVKGPLTMSDVVGFKMGWGSHAVHHIRANEHRYWYIKRHPRVPIRNRLNVPDCPEAVHMISDMADSIGIPRWYDYGPQRMAWLGHVVTNWMSDGGHLKALKASVRKPNLEGDIQYIKGRVAGKSSDVAGGSSVRLEVWAENQHREVTATGEAVVSLPMKDGQRP